MFPPPIQLTNSVSVHHDVVNVGVLQNADQALLIDFGSGEAASGLQKDEKVRVAKVLFTHHHRDQAFGLGKDPAVSPEVWVPEAEKPWFENVSAYWSDPKSRWHLYDYHPHRLMLTEPVQVTGTLKQEDILMWGQDRVSVIATPGHTDGSLSFLVESEGRRILFCGDVIHEGGKLWDLYSLQKGEKGIITDYHGFLGARNEILASLDKIERLRPDILVPSHGDMIRDPARCCDLLRKRLNELYEAYSAVSALRFYFPQLFASAEERKIYAQTAPAPASLLHLGTSWGILSEGHAFLMDCGSPQVIKDLEDMISKGTLKSIEGLWITHYHDDHVDAIPEFLTRFPCPVYTDDSVAQVVEDPLSWRIPCISPARIHVDRRIQENESWTWREWKMTGFHFPGQSEYHSGLLAEGQGQRLFFAGDSFTPSGMDDYCILNRNFTGENVGFARCVKKIRELKPDWIFNCHVNEGFHFTDEDCDLMLDNLKRRKKLFASLLPWEDPNAGMDETWLRVAPYEREVHPGTSSEFDLFVTWHKPGRHEIRFSLIWPPGWPSQGQETKEIVETGSERGIRFSVAIPATALPGRTVIPVDVTWDHRRLGPLTELILVVSPL